MAAVILPFALATGRQVRGAAPEAGPRPQGWMTLDLDGALSPLRGRLPAAAGRFPWGSAEIPALRRQVPAEAFLAIGRRLRRPANVPLAPRVAEEPPAAPRRMPRKHKLMLMTAALVLYTGGMEARRHWKPRAVLIEVPHATSHAIARLTAGRPAA
ncbi:hypothetical protein [Methylobacterium nonmethylotrophicum]|uniref:Uncharacterized protein n=1 Tax=Methylobacterium nonmethylotrophicum TaxID=1141884 RepID=A0A4Z0NXK9_9HYPH|nr:hypothetical protein [Methylobacterium nonmethylotrophicum]TGE02589.1 hypothetical protein EU555_02160 [Methylobacterium nonmethylotrophicum]